MIRLLVCALAAILVGLAAGPALADPEMAIPVTLTLNVPVPGRYWFKYALFDRNGLDPLDPGREVWSESMDTAGPKRPVAARRTRHLLGTIASPGGGLDPADFTQQLWVQAFRWGNSAWAACSPRVKLMVQPYALFSSTSAGAGSVSGDAVGSDSIIDGAVTASDLQDGASRAEIIDDDGPGSELDSDLLDGQHASGFAPANHEHDSRYYTEAEVNALLGAPRTRRLEFPAASLSEVPSLTTVSPAPSGWGLNWTNDYAEAAQLTLRRPLDWNGTSPVVVSLFFLRTTSSTGTVTFMIRPRNFDAGDQWVDTADIFASSASVTGSVFQQVDLTIPAARLPRAWWNLVIQRSGFAGDYPDPVTLFSVSISYEG